MRLHQLCKVGMVRKVLKEQCAILLVVTTHGILVVQRPFRCPSSWCRREHEFFKQPVPEQRGLVPPPDAFIAILRPSFAGKWVLTAATPLGHLVHSLIAALSTSVADALFYLSVCCLSSPLFCVKTTTAEM